MNRKDRRAQKAQERKYRNPISPVKIPVGLSPHDWDYSSAVQIPTTISDEEQHRAIEAAGMQVEDISEDNLPEGCCGGWTFTYPPSWDKKRQRDFMSAISKKENHLPENSHVFASFREDDK